MEHAGAPAAPPEDADSGRHDGAVVPLAEEAGDERHRREEADGVRSLSWPQRRFLLTLALPSLGLALALTVVTTFLPVLMVDLTGPAVTGVLIGSEGLLAVFVPMLVGARSDRLRSRFGRRRPFLVIAAPVAVVALVLMPLTASLIFLVLLLLVFYTAYFAYYSPYRALYPDLVPEGQRGRSQGFQGTMREVGLGIALVGGGLLLSVWRPLPFVISAAVLVLITAFFVLRIREEPAHGLPERRAKGGWLENVRLAGREKGVPSLIVATGLWEFALGALRTFVVLFLTVGLGHSESFSSLVFGVVAVAVIAAAIVGGKLADRLGHARLIHAALWVYGLGAVIPFLSQSPIALAVVPLVAFAAGIVMTLPFSMLMGMMPEGGHGAASGLFELGRGVGVLLGPALAGLAIHLLAPVLESTEGYAAVFPVAAAAILVSIPFFRRAERGAAASPSA